MGKKSQRRRKMHSGITYTVSIRGTLPAGLTDRVSAVHASSILKAAPLNVDDALEGESAELTRSKVKPKMLQEGG